MERVILIHYAEIGLKGKNQAFFENKLIKNIRDKFKKIEKIKVEKLRGRIILTLPHQGIKKAAIEKKLNQVFGIAWFAFVEKTESDVEKIKTLVKQNTKKFLQNKPLPSELKEQIKIFHFNQLK